MHFFGAQASRALSGFFPSEFWNRFLPQLSHRDTTVRHAVAAVGAMYERMIRCNRGVEGLDHFALQQYTKALQDFRRQLASSLEDRVDLVLIVCVLFVCLEMLRANNARAMDHVQGGLQILQQRLQRGKARLDDRLDCEIFQLFHRLNLQISFFGRPLLALDIPTEKSTALESGEPLAFETILQARECLTSLMNRALALVRSIGQWREKLTEAHYQQSRQEQARLKQEFGIWHAAFEKLRSKPPQKVGISDSRAPLLLLIAYTTSFVWLSNCLERAESSYDTYWPSFEIIVSAAEQIIELGRRADSSATTEQFTLDVEVTPMVYWTFQRCRHPLIRRRALEVMRRYPTLEGMWDKRRNVQTAELILEIEERPLCSLPVEQRVPEDKGRVYEALRLPENDVCSPLYPITLLMKPNGVDGEWEEKMEYLYWD